MGSEITVAEPDVVFPGETWETATPESQGMDLMFPPGTAFHYNRQSDLLAAVLTRRAGRSLKDLFFERIAAPIGITPETMDWKAFARDRGIDLNGGAVIPRAES